MQMRSADRGANMTHDLTKPTDAPPARRRARPSETAPDTLAARLAHARASLTARGATLAEIRDLLGPDGLLLLTVLLAAVFMVPVSFPGSSTILGAAILLIGISRLRGRSLWLPRRLAQRVLPGDKLRAGLQQSARWLRRLERVSRPGRLQSLVAAGLTGAMNNAALILGAGLLMSPLGFIPLSNTLPALALLLLAIGLLQRDGLCILLGHLANLAAVIYFSVLLAAGGLTIRETLWHWLHQPP